MQEAYVKFEHLNSVQQYAAKKVTGAFVVSAGAGSGKTSVNTWRVVNLITGNNDERVEVSPYKILALTFTNKAANEMRNRIESVLSDKGYDSSRLWISTFHSMCAKMLRIHAEKIGYSKNFTIYTDTEKNRVEKRLSKELKKNDIKAEYEKEKKKSNALDFDDLLLKALELLENCQEVREHYQNRFKYIHIDEFQDTDRTQYKIVKILAEKHKNIFVVGDEDQSIYSWRGAYPDIFNQFVKDFTKETLKELKQQNDDELKRLNADECKQVIVDEFKQIDFIRPEIIKLEENYRSTKQILDIANNVIKNNPSRIEKNLFTNKQGETPSFYMAKTDFDEAETVIKAIKNLKREYSYQYSDFAILMRKNSLTRLFEEKCLTYSVPYKVTGGFKFYDRKEIKDILAYLRVLANYSDNDAILRIINFPKRGIGETTIANLVNAANKFNGTIFDAVLNEDEKFYLESSAIGKKVAVFRRAILSIIHTAKRLNGNVLEFTRYIIDSLDLSDAYSGTPEEGESRMQNIEEFLNSIAEFRRRNQDATIEDYLQMTSLYSDLDDETNKPSVNIATVHSAKGLEYKCVFIIGLEEGIFPSSQSLDKKIFGDEKEIEEERRLVYVAITRARERLFASCSKTRMSYEGIKYQPPSRFLEEMGYNVRHNSNNVRHFEENANISAASNLKRPPLSNSVKGKQQAERFSVGMIVEHAKFGKGEIVKIDNEMQGVYAEVIFNNIKMVLSLLHAPLKILYGEEKI